jgi:hypothetical protein
MKPLWKTYVEYQSVVNMTRWHLSGHDGLPCIFISFYRMITIFFLALRIQFQIAVPSTQRFLVTKPYDWWHRGDSNCPLERWQFPSINIMSTSWDCSEVSQTLTYSSPLLLLLQSQRGKAAWTKHNKVTKKWNPIILTLEFGSSQHLLWQNKQNMCFTCPLNEGQKVKSKPYSVLVVFSQIKDWISTKNLYWSLYENL